jgi:hypothetical protein
MEAAQATLTIDGTTTDHARVAFRPRHSHDHPATGPPGRLAVPVYLRGIFQRGLHATLEVDGVDGVFVVKLGDDVHDSHGGEVQGSFEVLEAPESWEPPEGWPAP